MANIYDDMTKSIMQGEKMENKVSVRISEFLFYTFVRRSMHM